jgi:hypothetical protein
MSNIIFFYYFNQFLTPESFPKDNYTIFIIPDFIMLAFLIIFTFLYYKKFKKEGDYKNLLNLIIAYVFFIVAYIMQSIVNFFILFNFTQNTIFIFLEYQFLALVILGSIPLALFYNDFESESIEQFNFILIIGIILIFWMTVSAFFAPQSKWIMYISFIITSFLNSALINYYIKGPEEYQEKVSPPEKSDLSEQKTVP